MKIAVITGASRGIGLATTKKFLQEGWQVIGAHHKTDIPIKHERLTAIAYDQGDPASVRRIARRIGREVKAIDALVNCAGIILDAQDDDADIVKIRRTFDVDVFGIIELTQQLIPLMRKGSRIINISSLYGAFAFPIDDESSTGYRMAKAALNMYTRTLAFKLRPKGVVVLSIDPGWVDTDMGRQAATETERPDRQPHEPAKDIFDLVKRQVETGSFWRFGKMREW